MLSSHHSTKQFWRFLSILVIVLCIIALGPPEPITTSAQTGRTPNAATCSQLQSFVQKNLSTNCATIQQNQACYGNAALRVEFQGTSANPDGFAKIGDKCGLKEIKSIQTGPLNLVTSEWGLAVIKVQVNKLPGTVAGQAAVFVLYGETNLTDATPAEPAQTPASPTASPACTATTLRSTYMRNAPGPAEMQVQAVAVNTSVNVLARVANGLWVFAESQAKTGWLLTQTLRMNCNLNSLPVDDPTIPKTTSDLRAFYFSTGIGAQNPCKDVPPGGLLIQSPSGQKITFQANGVDITLGSSAILRAQAQKTMAVSVLEGQATVKALGRTQTVRAGQEVSMPLAGPNGLTVSGPPGFPRYFQGQTLSLNGLCNILKAANISIPCRITIPASPTPIPPTRVPPTPVPPTQVPPTQSTPILIMPVKPVTSG